MEDLSGKQLGPYQVVAPLGEGGIASVYKAYQPGEERYVALKILPRFMMDEAQFSTQFEQMAKAVAALDHPHILSVFDYGEHDNYAYLAMPLMRHGHLADLLKDGPLSLDDIRRIIVQLGGALDYAHKQGMVHQAVKPSNVLLDEHGDCLLTDFGMAAIVRNLISQVVLTGFPGTPAYMSPEQGKHGTVDKRSDIYALGIILYELVTGRVPYQAEEPLAVLMKHVKDPLPSPRRFAPELPEAVERVILKALAKRPEDRYQTAKEMVLALEVAIPPPPSEATEDDNSDPATSVSDDSLTVPVPSAEANKGDSSGKVWLLLMGTVLGGLIFGLVILGWVLFSLLGTTTSVSFTPVSSPDFGSTSNVVPTFTREPTRRPATSTPSPTAKISEIGAAGLAAANQTSPTSTTTASTTVAQVGDGWACLGFFGFGVTCLGESGWQTFTEDNSSLGGDLVHAMTSCPDGRILIAHTFGISAFDGRQWQELKSGWGVSSVDALACDADGGIWVAHFEGVSYFHDGQWTTYPSKDFAAGEGNQSLVEDIAVSPDGQVWVVTPNSVATLENEQWTIYQKGSGFLEEHFFDRITFDRAHYPLVLHSGGIFSFDGTAWSEYSNNDLYVSESINVDVDDKIWVGTFSRGVYVFDNGSWQTYDTKNSNLTSNHVSQIIIDPQDRIWLATSWGLTVIDGSVWHRYQMHNADIADNDIRTMAIVRSGPTLPKPLEKSNSILKGRIIDRSGEPITNTRLVVCVERVSTRAEGANPCDEQPFFIETVTDGSGNFLFSDVPYGRYRLIANAPAESWTPLTESSGLVSEQILVESGQEVDLFQLILTPEE
ncbi:MAG: protein kinase [Anaerolineae bacterium]|nr:protein kinase [Anaerolineae bacterium]